MAGIAGATVATASAYIIDVSNREDRAKNLGLIGAIYGVGFVLGPAMGGFLGAYDLRLPFFVAAGLSLANFLFGYFFVPESLAVEKRRPFLWARANPFGSLKRALTHNRLRGPIWATFFMMTAGYVYPVVWSFYGKEQFGWNLKTIGLSLAAYGACMIVVQGGLVGPFVKRMGDVRVIHMGNFIAMFGLITLGFASQNWLVFALLPIVAFADISSPALAGYAANIVDDSEQGELQGIFGSIEAMAAILAPPIFSGLFYAFTANENLPYLPGAPFLLSAIFVLAAVVILLSSLR